VSTLAPAAGSSWVTAGPLRWSVRPQSPDVDQHSMLTNGSELGCYEFEISPKEGVGLRQRTPPPSG